MTINNIFNMAAILELELISVTDHNSLKQYRCMLEVAKKFAVQLLIGVEVQTKEDVHVCCYFQEWQDAEAFGKLLEAWNPQIPNRPDYFGEQLLVNEMDEVYASEPQLLLVSLTAGINEVCKRVHEHRGCMVLAHVLDRSNSICTQLGFIPPDLVYDGIEVKDEAQKQKVLSMHPWIKDTVWLMNSDAHRLVDIQEAVHDIGKQDYAKLWRNAV